MKDKEPKFGSNNFKESGKAILPEAKLFQQRQTADIS